MTGFIGKAHLGALAIGVSAGLMGTTTSADIVHLDDVIIDGSLCVGLDCVNGESFGFDTLRLKENNLRIRAQDTSTSASFPTNDWQITFNDSANGGVNKFSIDDIDSGSTPFTIEARAPSHALYVDDGGRVGLGTSRPVVELHIPDGDTPTVRLEQNGTSGFTPQTWDMAGNETNFFIRDVTNGSLLPFRIRPGAPNNSIYVDADGDVGIGTNSPSAGLHVRGSDGSTALRVEEVSGTGAGRQLLHLVNNGNPQILLSNTFTNQDWELGAGLNMVIKNLTAGTTPFSLSPTGSLTLTGTITTSGSCSVGCDRVFNTNYDLPTIEEHAKSMFTNSFLPNVGPTPENGEYELTNKVLGMLNELEHAHIYITQLNDKLAKLEGQVAAMQ
ncbi:MAG: hypothetical protein KUG74_03520 [Rhodobacteraceae bacterium]|nr:hypothetical protein [Paracoccaceae bacterium]